MSDEQVGPVKTIEDAITILNRVAFLTYTDWRLETDVVMCGAFEYEHWWPETAIEVANLVLLREAAQPFIDIAIQIPESDNPVELFWTINNPELIGAEAMPTSDWRALAAWGEEQS